ncbi:MAG: tripartite tricarboxylate transporter permease [Candidatus Pacearchaeota archaeon]
MILEIILALFMGIIAGTFTGLMPGIHINLVAAIFLSATFLQLNIPIFLVLITSMAITHTFIDFIPSIFLGAPDEDTGLSTLPGHEFLLKGRGNHAVILTLIGSVSAILLLAFLAPLFIIFVPVIYPFLNRMLGWAILWIAIFLILTEKSSKLKATLIFFLAGFLGLSSLNLPIKDPLIPLLTGLFGTSTIIFSVKTKTKIPPQKNEKFYINKKELIKPTVATILVSPICALFPGLGSSQAAIIGSTLMGKLSKEQFLILIGSVNTLIMALSFVVLFTIQKNRTGIAAIVSQITILNLSSLKLILITVFLSTILLIPLTIFISKTFSNNIHKINYSKLSFLILIFLIIIVFIFSKFLGILVLFASTLLGLLCIELGVRRSFLMGCLLIPTIIYYLPI